jgi:hypothetical protein
MSCCSESTRGWLTQSPKKVDIIPKKAQNLGQNLSQTRVEEVKRHGLSLDEVFDVLF